MRLSRWGYSTVNETREQVRKMREANVPLEGALGFIRLNTEIDAIVVIWNDIDLYCECKFHSCAYLRLIDSFQMTFAISPLTRPTFLEMRCEISSTSLYVTFLPSLIRCSPKPNYRNPTISIVRAASWSSSVIAYLLTDIPIVDGAIPHQVNETDIVSNLSF